MIRLSKIAMMLNRHPVAAGFFGAVKGLVGRAQ